MISSGHVRLGTQMYSEVAVQWWYFRDFEDGWAFARGGRCRTTREARKLISDCHHECVRERHYFQSRPDMEMLKDGSLVSARGRSPYEGMVLKP